MDNTIKQTIEATDNGTLTALTAKYDLLSASIATTKERVEQSAAAAGLGEAAQNRLAASFASIEQTSNTAAKSLYSLEYAANAVEQAENKLTLAQANLAVMQDRAAAADLRAEKAKTNVEAAQNRAALAHARVAVAEDAVTAATAALDASENAQAISADNATAANTKLAVAIDAVEVQLAREVEALAADTEAKNADSAATQNLDARQAFLSATMVGGQRAAGGLALGLGSLAGASMPVIIAITGIAAALLTAVHNSMDWQEQLVLMQNNAGTTSRTVELLGKDILAFGTSVGANFQSMAIGARQILDYGFSASEAINILNESTQLAVATGAKEEDVAQAVAQALHQYGASGQEAAKYTGILYESTLVGNATLADFADNLKRVTGLAAAVGVPFEQVNAAVSSLTRNLGDTAQAQTQVLNVIRFILRPTQDEADAWDLLSKKSGDAAISSENLGKTLSDEGLTGILDRVNTAYKSLNLSQSDEAKATFDLVNGQRGGVGMLVLLKNGLKDYQDALAANTDEIKRNNDMQQAAARQAATAENAWKRLGDAWGRLTSEGGGFNDVMKGVAQTLGFIIQILGSLVIGLEGAGAALIFVGQAAEATLRGLTSGDWSELNKDWSDFANNMNTLADQLRGVWTSADDAAKGVRDLADALVDVNKGTNWVDPLTGKVGDVEESFTGLAQKVRISVSEMQSDLKDAGDKMGTDGAKGASEYVQSVLDKFAKLDPEVQASMAPTIKFLEDMVTRLGQYGGDGGVNYSYSLADGIKVNRDPIMSILSQYDSAFDKRQLYSTLGIDTGDNFGQGVKDRVAAWYEPIKAQLDMYLQAFELVAGLFKTGAAQLADMSAIVPGMSAISGALTAMANGMDSNIASRRAQLASLKADVDAQTDKAIAANDAKQAKKGPQGTDPNQEQVNEDRKTAALESAMATLQELEGEKKLRAEKDALAQAQQDLTDVTKHYDDLIKKVTDDEAASKAASEEKIHGLQTGIHALDDEMYNAKIIAENMLKPLQDEADKAKAKLKALQDETAAMDETFNQMAHPAEVTLQNLAHDAQDLSDKMRDVEDAERTAMAAINATIDQDQAAVDAAQASLDAITSKYEKLIQVKQDELNQLTEADTRRDQAKQLQDMAQSVGNLQARIENAIPGTKQYNALIKERDEAAANEKNKAKEFSLQDEITALKDQETFATRAAEARVKSAQAVLKAEQELSKEKQKQFDQEKENIRAQQEANDKAAETAQKELTNIRERKAEYDYEQHQKELAAQADVDRTQKALDDQTKITQGYLDSISAQREALSHQMDDESFQESERDRQFEKSKKQLQDQATLAEGVAQGIVDALNAIYGDDQKAQDNQKFADKFAAATNTLQTAIDNYNVPLGKAADGTKHYADNTVLVNQANSVLQDALNNQVTPAMQNFQSKVSPNVQNVQKDWMKYLGPPTKGGDTELSVEWYMDGHNKDGFYSRLITHADISLGEQGLKGMAEQRLHQLSDSMLGILETLSTDAGAKGEDIGKAILDGMTKGLADVAGNAALQKAMEKAVNDAIAAGAKAAEKGSPSEKTAREIGVPMGQGVAMGIDRMASLAQSSMSNLVNGVVGSGSVVGSGRGAAAYNSTTVGDVHVTLQFPNVRDGNSLPKDRNSYRGIGVAIDQEIAYAKARRGIPVRP